MRKILYVVIASFLFIWISIWWVYALEFISSPMIGLPWCYGPSAGDVDWDWDLDLYCTYNAIGNWSLLLNNGDATFTWVRVGYMYRPNNRATHMIDMDNDGDLDILVEWERYNLFLENLNNGSYINHYFTTPHIWLLSWWAAIADFNGDGYPDIYSAGNNTVNNRLILSTHTGWNFWADYNFVQWFAYSYLSGDAMWFYPAAGDLNGDNKPDIYAVSIGWWSGTQNRLYINQWSGIFSQQNISWDLKIWSFGNAIIADFDGNWTNDIYTTQGAWGTEISRLWLNDWLANFTEKILSGANNWAWRYAIATDIDNDGDIDIYNNRWPWNQLWLNDWLANFSLYNRWTDWGAVYGSVAWDFDNNGLIDIWVPWQHLWLQKKPLYITINAPLKISSWSITTTTITVTWDAWINITWVTLSGTQMWLTSNFNCIQTSITQVDCTVQIDMSGSLSVYATDNENTTKTKIETNYIIDTIPPTVPNITVNTLSPYELHTPQVTFSSTDNIWLDYCNVQYIWDDATTWSVSWSVITVSPATSPMVLNLDPDEILHTVKVKCYDIVWNYSENIIKFPPIVTFNTPTQISNTGIENATVTITSPGDNDIDTIQLTSSMWVLPILTDCVWDWWDTIVPYASPVTCEIHGIVESGTIRVNARDVVTNGIGENSVSFVIDTVPPIVIITAPELISHTWITTTTIEVTDDIAIYATGLSIWWGTTAAYSWFVCNQNNTTKITCSIEIIDDGIIEIVANDKAWNISTWSQTWYIIDTVYPNIVIIDDTNVLASTWDIVSANISDDIALNTWLTYYGFSDDAICDTTDSYIFAYSDWQSLIFTWEENNGKYICFQAIDHVWNKTYVGTTNPLQIDYTAPTINFVSWGSMNHEVNTNWYDPGYSAIDEFRSWNDLSVVISWTVNTWVLGLNTITYIVSDALWNTATYNRTVNVVDTTAPVFSGIYDQTIEINTLYTGYSLYVVSDNYWQWTGISVTITGSVNTGSTWNYIIQYTAVDNSGNIRTAQKIVHVVDTTPPIITILTPINNITIQQNNFIVTYTGNDNSSGVVYYECKVGSGSWQSCSTSWYNMSWLEYGTYTVSVRWIDPSGNISTPSSVTVIYATSTPWYAWWWGWTPSVPNKPVIPWNVEEIFNGSIEDGKCYNRGEWNTIDQWNDVSEWFKIAHQMLYSYWLTKWQGTADYVPKTQITREEAARFMTNFAKNVLCRSKTKTYVSEFTDLSKADNSLVSYIKQSYEYEIFKWDPDGQFRPKASISQDELSAIIVRMVKNHIPSESENVDWAAPYRKSLASYTQTPRSSLYRENIAEVLYDIYKNNKYSRERVGYVIIDWSYKK